MQFQLNMDPNYQINGKRTNTQGLSSPQEGVEIEAGAGGGDRKQDE